MRRGLRWTVRGVLAVILVAVVYLGVTLVQVWRASTLNQARPAQAIVVLGAAQYDGHPSPDLKARLDHAYQLWTDRLAATMVVTGGKVAGDPYSEASVGAGYLAHRGVPASHILWETRGRDSWQSLASAAAFLKDRHITEVLLVSDPFHDERISLMARELGLRPLVSPTQTSPIRGTGLVPYFVKETGEVALGRIIGFRRMVGVDTRVQQAGLGG